VTEPLTFHSSGDDAELPRGMTAEVTELEFHQIDLKYRTLRIRDGKADTRLLASLSTAKQRTPVLVVAAPQDGRYVLIDGYRRMAALHRLKEDRVNALVLPMAEADALLFRRTFEKSRSSAIEDAWLIEELLSHHGMSQQEVGRHLERSTSWVSRRLGLLRDLPAEAMNAVRRGIVCPQGAMKSLIPLARANKASCIEIIANIKDQCVSARQLGHLYATWKKGDAEQRQRIAAEPLLFLRVTGELERDAPRGVLDDIRCITTACQRACRRLEESASSPDPKALVRAMKTAQTAFDELVEALKEERHRVEHLHSSRDPEALPQREQG